MFGLSERDFNILMRIILNHADEFKRVVLFGSRARGNYRKESDIDLAIFFHEKNPVLRADFEDSKLSASVDLIDLALENNTRLNTFIQEEGVVLYDEKNLSIGEHWMTIGLLREKLTDYQNALARLKNALSKEIESDDLYLDGTIQRFEFTYELAWKLMKAYLLYLGVDVNNPRAAIRESMKQEVISDNQQWFYMIDKRNETTHTYHKEIALSVYAEIKMKFIQLFSDFETKISSLISAL